MSETNEPLSDIERAARVCLDRRARHECGPCPCCRSRGHCYACTEDFACATEIRALKPDPVAEAERRVIEAALDHGHRMPSLCKRDDRSTHDHAACEKMNRLLRALEALRRAREVDRG